MHVEHTYPVPPRQLFDVLIDPEFLRARARKFGGYDQPRVEHDAGVVLVTTPRQLPLEYVPAAARRFVGEGRLQQIDRWEQVGDARVSGEWSALVGNAPITMRGTHEIVPADGGCSYTVTGRVDVHVPLLGRRLAEEAAGHLSSLVRDEQEFAAEWLAAR